MADLPSNQSSFQVLYPLVASQGGYFAAAQAKACGYSLRQLSYYVKTGRFARIRRGVYRLAQFPTAPNEDLFAARLEVGPGAVVSHESALALYDLSDAVPARIHLTIPPTASRRHPGLALHTNRLSEGEVTSLGGLAVTTVERTIADVAAAGLAEELVVQAVREAVRRGLTTVAALGAIAERRGGRASSSDTPWRVRSHEIRKRREKAGLTELTVAGGFDLARRYVTPVLLGQAAGRWDPTQWEWR